MRYEYSERGELTAVYDRAGVKVREFEYHPDFLGRMSAHAYAGRLASQYHYDQTGRVIKQVNPFGITY